MFGVCLSTSGYKAKSAPEIDLNTTALPATFSLVYGTQYAACPKGVAPSMMSPCEPGASASDSENGDITG